MYKYNEEHLVFKRRQITLVLLVFFIFVQLAVGQSCILLISDGRIMQ